MASITATTSLFSVLDHEWDVLCARPATQLTLEQWGSKDYALAAFATMGDLVARIENRQTPVAEREEILSSLACLASGDELAARILLQLVLPGIKALLRRFYWSGNAERTADVVASVYARIRAFTPSPRPTWVAKRLFECARRRLRTTVEQQRRQAGHEDHWMRESEGSEPGERSLPASGVLIAEFGDQRSAAEELAELLEWATAQGHLRPDDAELIRLYRLDHVPTAELCALRGGAPASLERRRQRAESRLKAAAVGAA